MARRSGLGKGLGALIPTEVAGDRASALREVPDRQHPAEQPPAADPLRRGGDVVAGRVDPGARGPPAGAGAGAVEGEPRELRADRRRAPVAGRPPGRAADDPGARPGQTADVHSLEQALVENLHREDLNPLEEAGAYQQLIDEFGFTHEQVATRVGKSRAAVTNTLRLLQLPAGVQRALAERSISRRPRPGAARHPGPGAPGSAGGPDHRRGTDRPGGRGRGPSSGRTGGRSAGTAAAGGTYHWYYQLARRRPGGGSRSPGSSSWRSCWPTHLNTRVKVELQNQPGPAGRRVRHPRGPRADLPGDGGGDRPRLAGPGRGSVADRQGSVQPSTSFSFVHNLCMTLWIVVSPEVELVDGLVHRDGRTRSVAAVHRCRSLGQTRAGPRPRAAPAQARRPASRALLDDDGGRADLDDDGRHPRLPQQRHGHPADRRRSGRPRAAGHQLPGPARPAVARPADS